MKKVTIKQVRIYGHVDDKLEAIVKERLKTHNLLSTKTSVVAELIIKAHKRECKT